MNNITLTSFDHYLKNDGPSALVIREHLMPVEGIDGVLFPATFAAGDNFPGGYNIDTAPDGTNVCLIDSVGSQANRTEPMFADDVYKNFIPQIQVKAGDKKINILNAAHRAGDALVRCSGLQQKLQEAFKSILKGNAEPLAKIAPTSLVFGVWDSRDTQAKLPRLIASTIRAYNVRKLTRSAQFNPATEFVNEGLLDEPVDKAAKDAYSTRGFIHVPATGTHGGVIADGGIRRDATLSLSALRLLSTDSPEGTIMLRRYILGLALVAFTNGPSGYLRQGSNLVLDPDKKIEFVEVNRNGKRIPATVDAKLALDYLTLAAKAFGVGKDENVDFDKEAAKKDLIKKEKKGGKKAKADKDQGGASPETEQE